MGLMRFVFSSADAERFDEGTIRAAYLSGIDRTAWQVEASLSGNQLVMKRAVSDSARLHIPWQVEGHGRVVLSTGSLREDFGPYLLQCRMAEFDSRFRLECSGAVIAVPRAPFPRVTSDVLDQRHARSHGLR